MATFREPKLKKAREMMRAAIFFDNDDLFDEAEALARDIVESEAGESYCYLIDESLAEIRRVLGGK